MIQLLGTLEFAPARREQFRTGQLRDEWTRRYPFLFDEDDLRIATTQQKSHFFEWLAAVLVYESFGYRSLVEKYEFSRHSRKQAILEQLLTEEAIRLVTERGTQCPDLLSYAPDMGDWFFCEVKGPNDEIRPAQVAYFSQLSEVSGKPVRLIEFRRAGER